MRWALTFGMLLGAVPAWAASNVLSWSDNSTNEANFVIERKTEACTGTTVPFTTLATTTANIETYTDSAVSEGVTYCYRVAARNTAGTSAYSNTAGRQVPLSVPLAASGLIVGPGL